ncbi:MAG: 50S ribosomal protein L11 [Alphaproteobacteria bacterium]|nr:MAG: 50S ribosomal protein L11 [Alphaproteobacteria bacterium]
MAKKEIGIIKLQIPAGKANPAPPVGTALGPMGLNIMEFCKAFNAKTQNDFEPGTPVPVVITAYADRTFTFIMRKPPVSFYLKKAANLKAGSKTPGSALVGKLTMDDIRKIAADKMEDMNATDVEAASQMVAGSARSMGIEVVE